MAGLSSNAALSQAARAKTLMDGYNPIVDPDDTDYFADRMKRLTPSPARSATMKRFIESSRDGGPADLSRPTIIGPVPNYGLRPPIMDPNLPDFERYQPTSIE
jgi:hypothetical protein